MPSRDIYHDAVRNALIKDGWTITDDPFTLRLHEVKLYADLGAYKLYAVEREEERVVVEVKVFGARSFITEMDKLKRYRSILEQVLRKHAALAPSLGNVQTIGLIDADRNNYVAVDVGWDRTGRVHSIVFHFRLKDGKIWVEWDGTSPSATEDLIEAGVDEKDIVQALLQPMPLEEREHAHA